MPNYFSKTSCVFTEIHLSFKVTPFLSLPPHHTDSFMISFSRVCNLKVFLSPSHLPFWTYHLPQLGALSSLTSQPCAFFILIQNHYSVSFQDYLFYKLYHHWIPLTSPSGIKKKFIFVKFSKIWFLCSKNPFPNLLFCPATRLAATETNTPSKHRSDP